ncbi:MAG: ribosome-associated translation inhibitor RaiA [Actinomycetota bacterium]|jgi:putative sigma-54 modulation protein|nr:ribosome-associated translation inhibitor RaiA [Actinomycetota bacterium]
MEFIIKSKNIELDEKIRNYAERKIKDKIVKILDKVIKLEIKFTYEKNPRINLNNLVEVTVFTAGAVIRATDSGTDAFEAVDKVNSKLERQVKKYRDKLIDRGRKSGSQSDTGLMGEELEVVEDEIDESIVKTKTFILKPVLPEEAILQMELLGHDFFVFINSETGRTAVVYLRKDKKYGLIEPTLQ